MPVRTTRPPLRDGADGGVDGVFLGGAIDGAIHAAIGGVGQDLAGVVDLGGVERGVGAHVAGEFAAMGDGVDGPDAARAGDLEGGDGEQSDGSGAEDGDAFAGLDAGELQGVHGDGQRFDDGGEFQGQVGRDREEARDRQIDELAEKSGIAGSAQKADVGADVVMTAAAVLAVVAVDGRFERGAIAGLPAGDAGPGLDHGPGRFVAQHHGELARGIADTAFGVGVDIAAADADGIDPHLDFAGAGVFDRAFGQTEFALRDELGYKHCGVPTAIVNWVCMQNFRQFEAGPDPFGRKFQVLFKWMQTAISLRHADTVDVKFILVDENGGRTEKTIALPLADLLRTAKEIGRQMDDPWCSRLGAMHLQHLVETGEDMEKDLVTVSAADLKSYAESLADAEKSAVHAT